MEENKPSLLLILINLIHAYLNRLCDLVELASLEAKLAVRTFFSLTILFFFLCILFLSSWLCVLVLAYVALTSFHYSPLFAAAAITATNLLLLLLCGGIMWKIKRNLFFPSTRKQLSGDTLDDKEYSHEPSHTTN